MLLIKEIVDCDVNTVDNFQGQERDFIVLSMVRSNEDFEFGYLKDERRLNVAITRFKRGLIIVGDARNFKNCSFFTSFFDSLNDSAYVTDPETLISMISSENKNDEAL